MKLIDTVIEQKSYRNIFIVQDRNFWDCRPFAYDSESDLVLTFDFALKNQISHEGGKVYYLDHLVDSTTMEECNFKLYKFFSEWYLDQVGEDFFYYKGFRIGKSFQLAIWNDVSFRTRLILSLLAVKNIECEHIFAGIDDKATLEVIKFLDLRTKYWKNNRLNSSTVFYFPVFQWMDEKIYPAGFREWIKKYLGFFLATIRTFGKKIGFLVSGDIDVFTHPYHPTAEIIEYLKKNRKLNVVLEKHTWRKNLMHEYLLPILADSKEYKKISESLTEQFEAREKKSLMYQDIDMAKALYPVIKKRIINLLPFCLRVIDSINHYFCKKKLRLMLSITNIGIINCLMQNYCQIHGIPTFIIINGILASSYLDEAKDATWINSYGESIKKNYFHGGDHVVCLGDPRMDVFSDVKKRIKNDELPTVLIGAAGFSNIDLNSYVAFEFEFLNDIMKAYRLLSDSGRKMGLIIKVRPNGYIDQYRNFLEEYFPEIPAKIFDKLPMKQLYAQADFYISIYSQTLFEASCFGIPVLYYKKDTQFLHEPFDGKSELVTAFSVMDLVDKMKSFFDGDTIYDEFKKKSVLEKYIGPLDGKNLFRNLNFIYSLLNMEKSAPT